RTTRRTASGVTSTWTYDAASAPAELRTAGRSIRFAHDPAGREVGRIFGAATLAQTWDANDRLVEQAVVDADGQPRLRRVYRHRADDVLAGAGDLLSGRRRFEFDRLGRVTGVHRPGGSERYGLDDLGNVVVA